MKNGRNIRPQKALARKFSNFTQDIFFLLHEQCAYDLEKYNSIILIFFAAPPRIVLDPPYQIVRQGDSARIICTATGDQPIQIQWAKQGQPYLPRSVTARGGQLAFQSISLDDQGKLAKLIHFMCEKDRC